MLKYQFAYNELGKRVTIMDIPEEGHLDRQFTCISCGKTMKACIGKERRYFRHEQENVTCSNETYIHKLAKEIIKERFENSKTFEVEYSISASCDNNSCKYRGSRCMNKKEIIIEDLKSKYDTCSIETPVSKDGHRFIADILLYKSDDSSIIPTLIEIQVHHECEENKKHSGFPIVEIAVDNEEKAKNLLKTTVFRENKYSNVVLYGFEKRIKHPLNEGIIRYAHVPGKSPFVKLIPCDNPSLILEEDSDLEINLFDKNNVGMMDDLCSLDSFDNNNLPLKRDIQEYVSKSFYIEDCCCCDHCDSASSYYSEGILCLNFREANIERTCFKRSTKREFPFWIREIYEMEIVKNKIMSKSQFNVAICASKEFTNWDLAEDRFSLYLKNKLKDYNVAIVAGAVSNYGGANGAIVASHLSKTFGLPLYMCHADWEKNGKYAAAIMNNEILYTSNALIYFWNGLDSDPQYIVIEAKKRDIPVREINYREIADLCPICGNKMQQRIGKKGYFLGCIMYPECTGTRPQPILKT